ncbi:MAG: sigma-54 dependent transcriptional regulator [bacterium]
MAQSGKILIVDDDDLVLEALRQSFLDDFEVVTASSGAEALDIIKDTLDFDAIILDIRMAKMDGLHTAGKIRARDPEVPVIFHTGYPGEYSESAIDTEYRPFDYIGKNERPDRLIQSVHNAVRFRRMKAGSDELVQIAQRDFAIVGSSAVMREVYQTIEKIGPTDNKVMILGPTGSGKELVARALHRRSGRANRQLVPFNCNHKAPDLVESELFGHLRGSFTGAYSDQLGIIEYANGSTLFLDEIGNLDITTQGKLLRVLETGELSRIGSPEIITVDVRIICATNSNLKGMVDHGAFREDLYYRLKGITIELPALRNRREDIPELIEYFAVNTCRRRGEALRIFTSEARDLLIEYDWPGNVRQLADTVQSLIDLSASQLITREEVADYLGLGGEDQNPDQDFHQKVREYKRTLLIKAMAEHQGNVSATARALRFDPANLRKMLKSLELL